MTGVNLGGWLVLERWITPSLFQGLGAGDEYSFCQETGNKSRARLHKHREEFITRDDFVWLANHGVKVVRIPVGYWLFGDQPPFVDGADIMLKKALILAAEHDIGVIIDLHALPGSQNGQDHSGRTGAVKWHTDQQNITLSLNVVEHLAVEFGGAPNLLGIEVANEPQETIPHQLLLDYYRESYGRIRRHCPEKVAVIISDAFRPRDWQDALLPPDFVNVWLDTHLYQAFGKDNEQRSIYDHLRHIKKVWPKLLKKMQKKHPIIVGEWSLGLPPEAFRDLSEAEMDNALKTFSTLQQEIFKVVEGNFFWTYKTESMEGWSFRDCVDRGLIVC